MHSSILKKSLLCFMAFVVALSMMVIVPVSNNTAFAITEETEAKLSESQQRIEESAKTYDEAVAKLDSLEAQIEENEKRISELEELLPVQQEKSNEAIVALYKINRGGYSLLDALLSVKSINEFLNSIEYINQIQESRINEINRLDEMKEELEKTKSTLESSKALVENERAAAELTLENAKVLRMDAQKKAKEEAEAEAAEAAAAIAAAKAAEEAEKASAQAEETTAQNDLPDNKEEPDNSSGSGESEGGISDVDWSEDKTSFVNEWAPRIDAYLSGSPMSGCGKAYAEAAWNYGVDPRWSPAISNTESSKGAKCFKPHNAWGWGSFSWGSWTEAINAHVGGLARGYGYTISTDAAKKYCPGSWEHWYSVTLEQMNMI